METEKPLKLFFDGSIFSYQKRGGITRLYFEMIKSLCDFPGVEKVLFRGLYIDSYDIKKEWFKNYYGIKVPEYFPKKFISAISNIWLNMVYKKGSIYHASYYRIPKVKKGPLVVHVYDMIEELFMKNQKVIKFKKKAIYAADLIIAISNSCRQDILALYPNVSPAKIIVAYPGVSDIFFHGTAVKSAAKRPYILYVGTRGGYKNFQFLLETFIEKKYFLNFDLVAFGGEKELTAKQWEMIKNAGGGNWLLQKFGGDEALLVSYSGAEVFVYPSLYEGFGIPPLEAMAAGCPVIASCISSIPEVVGDAGLLFEINNKNDLAEKIDSIINDKVLKTDLIKKGKIRAKQFTWAAMAQKIYEGYKNIKVDNKYV